MNIPFFIYNTSIKKKKTSMIIKIEVMKHIVYLDLLQILFKNLRGNILTFKYLSFKKYKEKKKVSLSNPHHINFRLKQIMTKFSLFLYISYPFLKKKDYSSLSINACILSINTLPSITDLKRWSKFQSTTKYISLNSLN